MIAYTSSNIFDSPVQCLVNPVNTVGVMGKGIAAEFKKQYPEMFRAYQRHCKSNEFSTGQLFLYRTNIKWVLNFPTKKHWRSGSKPEWIEAGLKKLVETYADQGIQSIAMPQLGCGHGGLDWETQVKPLVERYLKRISIPVHVHLRTVLYLANEEQQEQ